MADVFDDLFKQIVPAIGSAIQQWNIGTQPIRDYYSPVYGLWQRGQEQVGQGVQDLIGQVGGDKTGAVLGGAYGAVPYSVPQSIQQRRETPTARQVILGERNDLAVANFLEQQLLQQFASFLGDIPMQTMRLQQRLREPVRQNPSRERKQRWPRVR